MAESPEPSMPKSTGYPQFNLNTGVSVAVLIMVAGAVMWVANIKSDVGYQGQRLDMIEAAVKEIRTSADATRSQQATSEIQQQVRLARIEFLLQDLISRMPDRERRTLPIPQ